MEGREYLRREERTARWAQRNVYYAAGALVTLSATVAATLAEPNRITLMIAYATGILWCWMFINSATKQKNFWYQIGYRQGTSMGLYALSQAMRVRRERRGTDKEDDGIGMNIRLPNYWESSLLPKSMLTHTGEDIHLDDVVDDDGDGYGPAFNDRPKNGNDT